MNDGLKMLVSEFEKVSDDAKKAFGNFTAEQINWKPSETGWSVGQCVEHLIKTNELFYGKLDEIAAGKQKNSFLENYSPLSGFFAKLLIGSLKKDERKFKAPSPKIVPPSEIDAGIIEKFAAHHALLIEKIRKCETADWKETIITSPFMKLMTYRLADGFTVVIEHERRHFRQAKRVTETLRFPK